MKRQSGTPTCGQPLYTGVVNENSAPGTFILTAAASSASGSPLTWSIQDTTLQRFSINPSTGAVTVAGSLARAALQRSALEFRIRATDNSNYLVSDLSAYSIFNLHHHQTEPSANEFADIVFPSDACFRPQILKACVS